MAADKRASEMIRKLRRCARVARPEHCDGCPHKGECGCQDLILNEAADLIGDQAQRIRELEERTRWISVEERLPEDDSYVLTIASGRVGNIRLDRAMELAEYVAGEGWILEMWPEWENPEVTHWKPIPEGPEVRA